jgi:hypothetical protein
MEFDKEFKDFLAWEAISRERVDVKTIYIDMASGDHAAGIFLSQLVYWYLIPAKDGKSKLRVKRDGDMWIAKGREEWYEEVRITGRQFDRVVKLLESAGIIEKKVFKFAGAPRIHIRIIVPSFIEKWHSLVSKASKTIDKPTKLTKPTKEKEKKPLKDPCGVCQQDEAVENLYDPDKRRCSWCLILDGWTYYMNTQQNIGRKRPAPKRTGTDQSRKLRARANARWKSEEFRTMWRATLTRCSLSGHLTENTWFTLEYFLRYEDTWRDLLAGKFDSFDEQNHPHDYARIKQWQAGKQAGVDSKQAGWAQI